MTETTETDQLAPYDKRQINENIRRDLLAAIKTMRDWLDRAERQVNRDCDEVQPHVAVRRCFHQFTWGQTNSSGSIESAMNYLAEFDAAQARETAK